MNTALHPTEITLHQQSRVLEITFNDAAHFKLPYEFLRVHSPSAEVRKHGRGREILQTGKQHVSIVKVAPVGQYALKITFDDKHDSGLYSWSYLYQLGCDQETLWQNYLHRLEQAGASRNTLQEHQNG